jgi:hypothetical protein
LKELLFSIAVLQLTGIASASIPKSCAVKSPTISPLSHSPFSSAISGRSPSPSVEKIKSNLYSLDHSFPFALSSSDTASVSIGTN